MAKINKIDRQQETEALRKLLQSPEGKIVVDAWKRDYIDNYVSSRHLTDIELRYKLSQKELIQSILQVLEDRPSTKAN